MKTPDPFVVDTSAVMTLLEDEPGADRVEQVLRTKAVFLPWTVLMEVAYISQQEHSRRVAEYRLAALKTMGATILWEMDEATLAIAADWKARYRVSFADAIIAAYASRQAAVLLHKDPEFDALAEETAMESLPYKDAG